MERISCPNGWLVEGNTAFALDLYSHLKETPGNLLFSPLSISPCLAMTYAGARGETETQMGRVLRFSKDQPRLHSAFGELLRQLNQMEKPMVTRIQFDEDGIQPSPVQRPGIQLDFANALWAQEGHPFLPAFLKIAIDEYHADVNQADFKTKAAAVTREINRWVAEKTNDKIHDILPPGSVDGLTRLVLANAIYFKGAWLMRFWETGTSAQKFHLSASSKTDVSLMSQTNDFKYTGNKDFQAVELPYVGQVLSMVILLPRQIDGCGQLENRLTPALLSSSLAQMTMREVEIHLPRFKLESSFDLKETLSKMGMPDAFGAQADLAGLDGERGLFI